MNDGIWNGDLSLPLSVLLTELLPLSMSNVVTTRHDGMFASPVAHLLRLIRNNNDDAENNSSAESYGTIVVMVVVIVIVAAHGHVKTHHG